MTKLTKGQIAQKLADAFERAREDNFPALYDRIAGRLHNEVFGRGVPVWSGSYPTFSRLEFQWMSAGGDDEWLKQAFRRAALILTRNKRKHHAHR